MTRHVYPNRMVAHIWAQRRNADDYGKSGNGNLSFSGDKLYSYAALIGRFVQSVNGETVALVSSRSWSITTSAHQSAAGSAVPAGIPCFHVPDLGEYGEPDHARNLKSYLDSYAAALGKARRARDLWDTSGSYVKSDAVSASRYAAAFGLPDPGIDTDTDWAEVLRFRAEREARLNKPGMAEKRERDRLRREELKREREIRAREQALQEASEAIALWRIGERSWLPYEARQDASGGAMLRVRGDNLETSQGASVPLSHAIKVFRRAMQCRETRTTWQRNGETIRVGHFTVDRLESDGTIRAGCHVIYWPEIEAAARVAGVLV